MPAVLRVLSAESGQLELCPLWGQRPKEGALRACCWGEGSAQRSTSCLRSVFCAPPVPGPRLCGPCFCRTVDRLGTSAAILAAALTGERLTMGFQALDRGLLRISGSWGWRGPSVRANGVGGVWVATVKEVTDPWDCTDLGRGQASSCVFRWLRARTADAETGWVWHRPRTST